MGTHLLFETQRVISVCYCLPIDRTGCIPRNSPIFPVAGVFIVCHVRPLELNWGKKMHVYKK